MAGARGGLHEAAYVDCPADVAGWSDSMVRTGFLGVPLRIAGELACRSVTGVAAAIRAKARAFACMK